MQIQKKLVRDTYRKFYRETKNSTEAWNKTLVQITGPYTGEISKKAFSAREQVVRMLMDVSKEVELEEGDPYRVAVKTAMDELRNQDAVKIVRQAYREYYQAVVDEVRRAAGFISSKARKQDWSPRNIPMQGETPPRSVEEALERSDPPSLFISFSEDGQVDGVSIDRPDYFRGWGVATAVIPVSDGLDEDDLQREVEEALGELEIWDQEQDTP